MKTNQTARFKKELLDEAPSGRWCARSVLLAGTAVGLLTFTPTGASRAASLYSGTYNNQSLEINLDTTLEYSNIYRVNDPSAILTNNINGDEGDRDFRHGFVSNEFEVLPVFDLKYGNYGVHVSGEAFLNTSYLDKNQNNSPGTFNPYSTASNRDFTSATRNVNGENAKLLDAFVFGSQNFGANDAQQISIKFGRQTLLWGQSLFFTGNGIAAGQAPIDIQLAQSTPNAQAQQVFLPVGQAVITYQPNSTYTIQAYYQFEWAHDAFQGVGAYFSSADILDKGGQRIIAVPDTFYLYRIKDVSPPIENGQFGASIQATYGNYDLGLYGLRYDSKAPEVYTGAPAPGGGPGNIGSYYLIYPRDIQIYGASFSTTVGAVNVAGELSGRRNMPLVSGAAASPTYPGPANSGALYAVGSTMAGQISEFYLSPALRLVPGGVSVLGEFAVNHVLSVDGGRAELTPGRDNTAGAFQWVVTPGFFPESLPNLELQFPVGMEYGLFGRSEIDGSMNHGMGSVNVGVTATYRQTWVAGLVYNDYIGAPNPNFPGGSESLIADRGYLSFNIEHTF